jgi:hypothetical protein
MLVTPPTLLLKTMLVTPPTLLLGPLQVAAAAAAAAAKGLPVTASCCLMNCSGLHTIPTETSSEVSTTAWV